MNVRVKVNLIGNDGGDFKLAVVPYLKIPANTQASVAIGNNAVEAAGILTVQIKLPQDFQLGVQTEIDAYKAATTPSGIRTL